MECFDAAWFVLLTVTVFRSLSLFLSFFLSFFLYFFSILALRVVKDWILFYIDFDMFQREFLSTANHALPRR